MVDEQHRLRAEADRRRTDMSLEMATLWAVLKGAQAGVRFTRYKPKRGELVDLWCKSPKIAIAVDQPFSPGLLDFCTVKKITTVDVSDAKTIEAALKKIVRVLPKMDA